MVPWSSQLVTSGSIVLAQEKLTDLDEFYLRKDSVLSFMFLLL